MQSRSIETDHVRPRQGEWSYVARNPWAALGALLIITGTIGSIVAANGVARSANQQSQKEFVASGTQVAATLKLAIQHEEDFVVSLQAFFLTNPHATETQLLKWSVDVRALERYPEIQQVGNVVLVPASALGAYGSTVGKSVPFQLVPPGSRPFYCFGALGFARAAVKGATAGFDFCASPPGQRGPLMTARDSGRNSYQPLKTPGAPTTLVLGAPIYQGGRVPATVAARRAAFVEWIGMSIVPNVVLTAALQGHSNTAVTFRYGGSGSAVVFHSGSVPTGARMTTIDLHNGWTVQVLGVVVGGGVFGNGNALALLLAGIALSVLLGTLIYVLGTGRGRLQLLVHERTDQLQFQALHDSLTGLANRALILDRVGQMLARGRRYHVPTAAMFLDLDNFKDINDTLGHQAGDQLLVAVGERLSLVVREADTVGRLGGDEFVLLVEGASLAAGPEVVADRILELLDGPFDIAGSDHPLSISASIGIASGDRLTPDELLRDADIALYRAKDGGKKRAVVFAQSMQKAAEDHRNLDLDLRTALEADEFFLVYQPTIDLQTGAFTGVEALLRWRHPERGVIGPDDFVPALEENGLIVPVGAWVLETACRQGAAWHARGHSFAVSVNVSVRQVEQHRIVEDVRRALSVSGFDPRSLILEITETTLMSDVAGTIDRLQVLKTLGVRIAVDDFGTGYSSLAYLRAFPIDILKIDRTFVSGMANSTEAAALVHTLVQLGKALDLETVAEGVEDDDQRIRLELESVDTGQGFLFSRPLDASTIDRLLEDFIPGSEWPKVDIAASESPR